MAELLPGVHSVDGVTIDLVGAEISVHPILIMGAGRLTLIDVGPVGAERPIRAYVENLGYRMRDIERIIVTHHHADHTGGLAQVASQTDAIVAAHAAEVPFLERRVAAPARPLTPEGVRALGIDIDDTHYALDREWEAGYSPVAVKVTEELQGGDTLPLLGGLQVLHDPGHSPGHIALWSPEQGILFASDLFTCTGNEIQIPLPIFTQDAGQAVESLRGILETCAFETAIPYHGLPLMENAADRLRRAIAGVRLSVGHALPGQVLPV